MINSEKILELREMLRELDDIESDYGILSQAQEMARDMINWLLYESDKPELE